MSNTLGWRTLSVASLIEDRILEIGDGYRAKNSEMGNRGLPFLRIANVGNGGFDLANADLLDEANLYKTGSKTSQVGDVVFTTKGSVGRFAYVKPETPRFVYSPQVSYWRVLEKGILDSRFLLYWLQGPEFTKQVYRVKGLTDMADYVNLRDQRNMIIRAPSLPTQRKIADILSAYDDLIENNTRRIKLLEEMAQTIYREWFVHFRFPGHEQVAMVETELGMMPEGWEIKQLGDFAQEMRRSVQPNQINPDTPYLGLEHFPRKSIALSEWGAARDVVSTKLAFKEGEILFGKIRPYFHKVGVAPVDGVCSSDTIVIVPRKPEFFGLTLASVSSTDFVDYATLTSKGTKMPRADWSVLTKYPLLKPPDEVLSKFGLMVRDYVALIQNLIFRNRNLRHTRDLLLPKLVSGEVRVDQERLV